MHTTISRREFIRIAGISAAAAAAGTAGLGGMRQYKLAHRVGDPDPYAGATKIPTFCEVCFWHCGAEAYVRDGELLKIEGNPLDPLANGRLCPRGMAALGFLNDPDRLRRPLIRYASHSGEQKFREAPWEEALDTVAQKLLQIRKQEGPEAVALLFHGKGGPWFEHLMKAFGTPNLAEPAYAQCLGPREVGFWLTYGAGFGTPEPYDVANSRALVLIGSHLGENMHNTAVQEFADAVDSNAYLVVVDPRYSVAASKADRWLPIKPGTDMALLLSWINVVLTEGLIDDTYLQRYATGLDQLRAAVRTYTPERAEAECDIPAEMIREAIREVARQRPHCLVYPGRHVVWYGDDTQRMRAVAILNALLGAYGRPGGIFLPTTPRLAEPEGPPFPEPKRGAADGGGTRYPFGRGTTIGLRDATLSGSPYPIKAWLVYATNLVASMPDTAKTLEAIHKLEMLVAIDTMPAEITGWADVVLPECTYLERYDDLRAGGGRVPFIQLRQPVVEPKYDSKPGWWIARELGERLGLSAYFPWKDVEEYLRARLRGTGVTLEQLKKDGTAVLPARPLYIDEQPGFRFGTPSGKIELYSEPLASAGFDAVPRYTPPEEPPDGFFRLLYGRSPVHSFSRTQNNRLLARVQDENDLWLSPSVAGELGISTGDRVFLTNQDGVRSTFSVRVQVTERIRRDCVYMAHGFGHTDRRLRQAFGKGASDTSLITRYAVDPIIGSSGLRVNFVRLEKEA